VEISLSEPEEVCGGGLGGWQRLSLLSRTCGTSGYVGTESMHRHIRAGLAVESAPVRNATAAAWSALVLVAPFPEAVLVQWVSADRPGPDPRRHVCR
jgi:hypothetical protein